MANVAEKNVPDQRFGEQAAKDMRQKKIDSAQAREIADELLTQQAEQFLVGLKALERSPAVVEYMKQTRRGQGVSKFSPGWNVDINSFAGAFGTGRALIFSSKGFGVRRYKYDMKGGHNNTERLLGGRLSVSNLKLALQAGLTLEKVEDVMAQLVKKKQ